MKKDFLSVVHSKDLLLFLNEMGSVNQIQTLQGLHLNNGTLNKLLEIGSENGLLTYYYDIKTTQLNKKIKVKLISLTDLGKTVAGNLKNAEDVISSEKKQIPDNFEDQFQGLGALTHLNVLDDHIVITDTTAGMPEEYFVYVKLNGHGILRLWCERDQTFQCRHTRYSWTLPDVQEMVEIQYRQGNIKRVDE